MGRSEECRQEGKKVSRNYGDQMTSKMEGRMVFVGCDVRTPDEVCLGSFRRKKPSVRNTDENDPWKGPSIC